jgi:hypothetical protein
MKMNLYTVIFSAAMAFVFSPAIGHEAHVHGIGKLDVAVEGANLSLHLDTPLANLLGFEHSPRSDMDKKAVQQMAHTLGDAGILFAPTLAAECRIVSANLKSSILDQATAKKAKAGAEKKHQNTHADLDADYTFTCAHPERLNSIDVKLFTLFKGFQQIDVQIISQKRQSAQKLLPNSSRISW